MARFGNALCFAAGVITCAVVTTSLVSTEGDHSALQQAEPPRQDARVDAMSMEMIERCLEIAEEIDPSMAERLRLYCSDDPDECRANFMRVGSRLLELARLQDRDPQLYGFKIASLRQDVAVAKTAEELRAAIAEDDIMVASKLENQLKKMVEIQLAMTIAERGELLKRLKAQADRLTAELAEYGENFDTAVSERLEQLKCGHDPVKASWPTRPSSAIVDEAQDDNATN